MLKSKYNCTTAEVVQLLNKDYIKPLSAADRAIVESNRLNYEILSDISLLKTNRDKLELKCKDCGYIHITSITSLSGTILGCPKCKSGNLPWNKRSEELNSIVKDRLNSSIESNIPSNQTGYITLKHICGTTYTVQLVGIVSPTSTNRATCPNCRPSDRRITKDNITFWLRV